MAREVKDKFCDTKEISSFLDFIDTYRRWKHYRSRNERKYDYYHPSELGKCLREQQYKHYVEIGSIKKKHYEIDSQSLRLFDKGHNMHNRWARYFEEMGVLKGQWKCKNNACYFYNNEGKLVEQNEEERKKILNEKGSRVYGTKDKRGIFKPDRCECGSTKFNYLEVPVFDKSLFLKGSADLVLDFSRLDFEMFSEVTHSFDKKYLPKKGEEIVADMKTIGQDAWNYQLMNRGAHQSYLIQLTIYVYVLDCAYGLLIYENKNNSKIKCFKVERNDSWWNIIKWQLLKMKSMIPDKQLPPPRPKDKSSYECRSCNFSNICHKSAIWKDPHLDAKRRNFYKGL